MNDTNQEENLLRFALAAINQVPVILLGSGASAAHGIPGMGPLAIHLGEILKPATWSPQEEDNWERFRTIITSGTDLESALQRVNLTPRQTDFVASETREFLLPFDLKVLSALFEDRHTLPLSRLFRHMLQSTRPSVSIVTTNYDRIAEYAANAAGFQSNTGFTPGLFQTMQLQEPVAKKPANRSERSVDIWKVHGSLDWFINKDMQIVASPPIERAPKNHTPLMVTPGLEKYRKTHHEPFRTTLRRADEALLDARSFLCVGYGFNDEHIQQKLVDKCDRDSTPLVILTKSLTPTSREFLGSGRCRSYVALEESPTGTTVYSNKAPAGYLISGKSLWQLNGLLTAIGVSK